jgi:hypothetical protein
MGQFSLVYRLYLVIFDYLSFGWSHRFQDLKYQGSYFGQLAFFEFHLGKSIPEFG